MVNFKEKLFAKSKPEDDSKKKIDKSSSKLKDERPPSSSRSYSSTKTFSILGRSSSASPSPSPTFGEHQSMLRSRNASGGATSSANTRSSSLSQTRRSRSPTPLMASHSSTRSPSPLVKSLWNWKIEEPNIRTDEIDYTDYQECYGCKKPIYKDMVQLEALSKLWHPECFHCSSCAKVLTPPEKFMELNGKPYCEQDYNELFFPKCFVCTKTIFENEVRILQKSYHPNCFTCRKCSQPLCPYTQNFIERNGSYYCVEDYHDLFSPKCYECDQPIRDPKDMTRALGTTYHREHFTCFECRNPLPGNNIWKKNGSFYCEEDYHKLFSPICAGCFEPIRHNGISALGKDWHGDCCLRCASCQKILQPDNFIQVENQAYCRNDWLKYFGPKCADCKQPIWETLRGEGVIAMGLDFHPGCFRCADCLAVLNENTFYEHKGKPYCHEHFHGKTCVDCIKKDEQVKLMRQQSIDQFFDDQIYGPSRKNVKISSRPTSRQTSLRSRSISPIDYLFRSKSSQK